MVTEAAATLNGASLLDPQPIQSFAKAKNMFSVAFDSNNPLPNVN